jgi:hypothetical protein
MTEASKSPGCPDPRAILQCKQTKNSPREVLSGTGTHSARSPFPSSSGSRAMLMAMRRASSFVSIFAWRASASSIGVARHIEP